MKENPIEFICEDNKTTYIYKDGKIIPYPVETIDSILTEELTIPAKIEKLILFVFTDLVEIQYSKLRELSFLEGEELKIAAKNIKVMREEVLKNSIEISRHIITLIEKSDIENWRKYSKSEFINLAHNTQKYAKRYLEEINSKSPDEVVLKGSNSLWYENFSEMRWIFHPIG